MDAFQVERLGLLAMEKRSKILPRSFWESIQVSGKCPRIASMKSAALSAVPVFVLLRSVV